MPELPEIETIKKYLEKELVGKKIISFQNFYEKNEIKPNLLEQKIISLQRRGKLLIFNLSHNWHLLFHLKLTGQLFLLNQPVIKETTRVIFKLSDGKFLIFNDARKFGWVRSLTTEELEKELSKLGPEPFSKEFNFQYLKNIFSKSKRPIKLVLMDQEKIAGIGNIYANEALFLTKINPLKPADKLTDNEIKRLKKSILEVLKRGIRYEGSSLRFYLKPDKSKGKYQEYFLVYDREGEKCYHCGSIIKRIELGGRGTYFCPKCQK